MAEVHVISVGVVDFLGKRKTIPLYAPAATSLATLASILDTTLNAIDDAIDGQIVDISVQLSLTLPSGLKSAPVTGNKVYEGANLTYDPADTNFAFSIYIPSWKEAGFAGDVALTTGVYGTAEDQLVTDNWTDKDGNTFDGFTVGSRVKRK